MRKKFTISASLLDLLTIYSDLLYNALETILNDTAQVSGDAAARRDQLIYSME